MEATCIESFELWPREACGRCELAILPDDAQPGGGAEIMLWSHIEGTVSMPVEVPAPAHLGDLLGGPVCWNRRRGHAQVRAVQWVQALREHPLGLEADQVTHGQEQQGWSRAAARSGEDDIRQEVLGHLGGCRV